MNKLTEQEKREILLEQDREYKMSLYNRFKCQQNMSSAKALHFDFDYLSDDELKIINKFWHYSY